MGGLSLIGAIIFLERKPSLEPVKTVTVHPLLKLFSFVKNKKDRRFDDEDELQEELVEEIEENLTRDEGEDQS